jgi:hypothetical protein
MCFYQIDNDSLSLIDVPWFPIEILDVIRFSWLYSTEKKQILVGDGKLEISPMSRYIEISENEYFTMIEQGDRIRHY